MNLHIFIFFWERAHPHHHLVEYDYEKWKNVFIRQAKTELAFERNSTTLFNKPRMPRYCRCPGVIILKKRRNLLGTRLRSKVRNHWRMKAKAFRLDALPCDCQTRPPQSLEALNCNLCGRMSLDRGAGSGMHSDDSFHVVVQKLFYLICATFTTERARGKRTASLGLASTRKIPQ